jgi:hypothetical protein
MGMPNGFELVIPNDGAGNAIVGEKVYGISDLVCAFDFVKGAGMTFTGALEASVGGNTWTSIDALAATTDGTIGNHYQLIRIKVTGAGVIGTGTELWYRGKS